jgi:LysR family transcriptional regulator, cell division regulator
MLHTLSASQSRVDTLFIQRRGAHLYSALEGFVGCLNKNDQIIAA